MSGLKQILKERAKIEARYSKVAALAAGALDNHYTSQAYQVAKDEANALALEIAADLNDNTGRLMPFCDVLSVEASVGISECIKYQLWGLCGDIYAVFNAELLPVVFIQYDTTIMISDGNISQHFQLPENYLK